MIDVYLPRSLAATDPKRTVDYHDGVSAFTLGNTNKIASLLGEIGRSTVKAGTLIFIYNFCTGVIGINHERA